MFAKYTIARTQETPAPQGFLYEYIMAGNGLFLRAERPGLSVLIPLSQAEVRGLPHLTPFVEVEKVPAQYLRDALRTSQWCSSPLGLSIEALFHLWRVSISDDEDQWKMIFPEQFATQMSVIPVDSGADSSYAKALIDLHSHHGMKPYFSPTDNADETGFRIYAVLGDIFKAPALLVRVGVYGYWWELPADLVFELPDEIQCAKEVNHHEDRPVVSTC